MIRASTCVGLAGALALGACAVAPPSGPSFAALPGHGKSFEQFQVDDGGEAHRLFPEVYCLAVVENFLRLATIEHWTKRR